MSAVIALLLAAAQAAPATDAGAALPDEIGFEMEVGFGGPSGFRIDRDEHLEVFDGNPHRTGGHTESRVAAPGSYARVAAQFARYRPLATGDCQPQPGDVITFRFTWREAGEAHTATFADSCQGIPDDLVDTLRPIADIVEGTPPPESGAPVVTLTLPPSPPAEGQ